MNVQLLANKIIHKFMESRSNESPFEHEQIIGRDINQKKEIADYIEQSILHMDRKYRCVRLNMQNHACFLSLVREIANKLLSDSKFEENDTEITKDYFEDDYLPELESRIGDLLDDFTYSKIWVLILLENYENACSIWKPGDFGWMRDLGVTKRCLGMVSFSDRVMNEVSMYPDSSSPFSNIFEHMEALDEE